VASGPRQLELGQRLLSGFESDQNR
jgi:hypothetical protein